MKSLIAGGVLNESRMTPDVLGGVRTRTVARVKARIASGEIDDAAGRDEDLSNTEKAIARVVACILAGLVAIGSVVVGLRRARREDTTAAATRAASSLQTSSAATEPPSSDTVDSIPSYEFVQRRREEEIGFAVQRAVGATADVFRDRLRVILEHQDGPQWLEAFNRRRLRRCSPAPAGNPSDTRSSSPAP